MLRSDFVSLIATVDVMVGNSSAGIIEAATFGTPVVNVGTRQFMRERNANVVDVEYCAEAITSAVRDAISKGKTISPNVYGDGSAGSRIVEVLAGYELDASLLAKSNAY